MAKMSKVDRARQLMERGKLSKADFGAIGQMSKTASARAGFGGADDGDGNEMPGALDEEQEEGESAPENVSPEMIKAGVVARRGKLTPVAG